MNRKNKKSLHLFCRGMLLIPLLVSLAACAGLSEKDNTLETQRLQPTADTGAWTWVSGDSKTGQRGVYGTQGITAATNKPGARSGAVSWVDSENNLWLFGGFGFADKRIAQYLSDLWKFDGESWTWVSGDNTGGEQSVLGARAVAGIANKPGGRTGAVSWIDSQGNLWLFGGYGYADHWNARPLNDLWKFDGKAWTWVSGDCIKDDPGVYGTRGIAEITNQPGARRDAVSWTDAAGNLWLFGGYGYDQYGAEGYLNDLWEFDGVNWTWVSGDNTIYEACNYGSQGITASTNKPGSRSGAVGWIDSRDNLWLYGGHGNANISWKGSDKIYRNPESTGAGYLNDLWKFDGTNWTWISGDKKTFNNSQMANETTGNPAARLGSVSWVDPAGSLWLFGGNARVRFSQVTNDLWKYNGTNWICIYKAASHKDRQAVYGTRGVAAETNRPGARTDAVGWVDSNGTFWLFGGEKPQSADRSDYFNDLWKYEHDE